MQPKILVIFADGTGNAESSENKTNVWRLKDGLDVPPERIYYDDGVGTAYWVFSWVGLGFGFGLKKNVLDLYRFLCEHHQDNCSIYAFGFSRGAFTVRLLVDLIQSEGLLKGQAACDLPYLAAWAYRSHRRQHGDKFLKSLLVLPRTIRDVALLVWDRLLGRKKYNRADKTTPDELKEKIFVGVWDTVDAYAMSIDTVAKGIDRYVTPIRFDLSQLPPVVNAARHALSLDDERTTFHPLLWDDKNDDRIEQVWFAGVHADVGGGYENHRLSLVSLNWMIQERGLPFKPKSTREWSNPTNTLGEMHDSRRRWKSLYRYGPRRVPGPDNVMRVPKIHASVLERVDAQGYAPMAFPARVQRCLFKGRERWRT